MWSGRSTTASSLLHAVYASLVTKGRWKVFYLSMNHFVHQLKSANTKGITEEFFEKLNKYNLLIFDDFALHPIDESTRLALLTLLDDRYEKKSVIITSQLPYDKWYDYIGQTTVADAILDRIQHSSHLIRLEGQSMRENRKKLYTQNQMLP